MTGWSSWAEVGNIVVDFSRPLGRKLVQMKTDDLEVCWAVEGRSAGQIGFAVVATGLRILEHAADTVQRAFGWKTYADARRAVKGAKEADRHGNVMSGYLRTPSIAPGTDVGA